MENELIIEEDYTIDLNSLPSTGLRLMQPHATEILEGKIPLILRSRPTSFRGRVLLLTSKKIDKKYRDIIGSDKYPLNRAIGTIEIIDCIETSRREIEDGKFPYLDKISFLKYPKHLIKGEKLYAWILKNPIKFPNPIPYSCPSTLNILVKNVKLLNKEMKEEEMEKIEKTSVWDFGKSDEFSAHHIIDFHGWFPPQIPRNCILRYSQEGDIVVDCFVGSGTTLVECKRYNRRGIGLDITPEMIRITNEKLKLVPGKYEQEARVGDARELLKHLSEFSDIFPELKDPIGKIDCIVTHPPYWKAIKYSKEHGGPIKGDLSLDKTLDEFLEDMRKVFGQMFQALKPGGYCCVTIGDIGEKGYLVPLGFYLMQIGLEVGFKIKDIAIWVLSGERSLRNSVYRLRFTEGHNSLLIKHNYVLIFQKPEEEKQ